MPKTFAVPTYIWVPPLDRLRSGDFDDIQAANIFQEKRQIMSDESNLNAHISLTSEIVSAYVSKNPVPTGELPALIASVHASLAKLDQAQPPKPELTPAVPIKKSVTREWIVCLEDGKKFKSLKRHLSSKFDMTPDQYREKWGLPHDYPMVAPVYAEARSALAKQMGLGRKAGQKAPAKRTRRKAA